MEKYKMTPSPHEDSLEETIRKHLSECYVPDVAGVAVPGIMQLIEADRASRDIDSRIDELKHVDSRAIIKGRLQPITVKFRLAELKEAQQGTE